MTIIKTAERIHITAPTKKNEALRDLLLDAKNAKIHIERSKSFAYHLRMWVAEIESAKSKDIQAMTNVMDSIRAQIVFLEKQL